MKYYTGIGSRETPQAILVEMTRIAVALSDDWVLRSGGANGADTAFENGAKSKEIYLPWNGFNGNSSHLHLGNLAKVDMASKLWLKYHKNPSACNQAAQKFMTRNMYQVLGKDLDTPSEMLVCWTPGGKLVGGTSVAIKLAMDLGIPVYNLAVCGMLQNY
jgi:hypothetical protein